MGETEDSEIKNFAEAVYVKYLDIIFEEGEGLDGVEMLSGIITLASVDTEMKKEDIPNLRDRKRTLDYYSREKIVSIIVRTEFCKEGKRGSPAKSI